MTGFEVPKSSQLEPQGLRRLLESLNETLVQGINGIRNKKCVDGWTQLGEYLSDVSVQLQ